MSTNIEHMKTLPLVQAIWWAIENFNLQDHTEEFFYLRERYRVEEQINEMREDSRLKGWALAKSLQTQVDILDKAIWKIATIENDIAHIVTTAQNALCELREHKES